jgi:hypothetical protein
VTRFLVFVVGKIPLPELPSNSLYQRILELSNFNLLFHLRIAKPTFYVHHGFTPRFKFAFEFTAELSR